MSNIRTLIPRVVAATMAVALGITAVQVGTAAAAPSFSPHSVLPEPTAYGVCNHAGSYVQGNVSMFGGDSLAGLSVTLQGPTGTFTVNTADSGIGYLAEGSSRQSLTYLVRMGYVPGGTTLTLTVHVTGQRLGSMPSGGGTTAFSVRVSGGTCPGSVPGTHVPPTTTSPTTAPPTTKPPVTAPPTTQPVPPTTVPTTIPPTTVPVTTMPPSTAPTTTVSPTTTAPPSTVPPTTGQTTTTKPTTTPTTVKPGPTTTVPTMPTTTKPPECQHQDALKVTPTMVVVTSDGRPGHLVFYELGNGMTAEYLDAHPGEWEYSLPQYPVPGTTVDISGCGSKTVVPPCGKHLQVDFVFGPVIPKITLTNVYGDRVRVADNLHTAPCRPKTTTTGPPVTAPPTTKGNLPVPTTPPTQPAPTTSTTRPGLVLVPDPERKEPPAPKPEVKVLPTTPSMDTLPVTGVDSDQTFNTSARAVVLIAAGIVLVGVSRRRAVKPVKAS